MENRVQSAVPTVDQVFARIEKEEEARIVWKIDKPQFVGAPGEGEDADLVYLVATDSIAKNRPNKNYSVDGQRIQERWVHQSEIEKALNTGHPQRLVQWIEQGEICMDHNALGAALVSQWESFPDEWREQQLLSEFSSVVQHFYATKKYLESGHTLDSFSCMLQTMVHWARIVIIEQGMHPESLVWEQVKHYNLGVYKLYEELLTSPETIEQRVQLILLAAEFSMMSKMKSCSTLLISVLSERCEPWSLEEIAEHPRLSGISADWSLLLNRLARRQMVREVHVVTDHALEITEIRYTM